MPASDITRLSLIYEEALALSVNPDYSYQLTHSEKEMLDEILENSEGSRGVLAVIITSLYYKILHPSQDIRNHQAQIPNGYSGRSFDSQIITPFLKDKQLPAMASSGWLTRSLEQSHPYSNDYPGKIRPVSLKTAFLGILNKVELGGNSLEYLKYIFVGLIRKRDSQLIRLSRPSGLPIKKISEYINEHFNATYRSSGASRLPTLVIYAAYECLMSELKRFEGKTLLPLESHTSADSQSGRIGDIDMVDNESKSFESVEIKFNIEISLQIVRDAFSKFNTTQVQRYYILSTSGINENEKDEIYKFIESVRTSHGCQIVVNGVEDTLKYYLRLIENPADFIEKYVTLLEGDEAIKFEHRKQWNDIASRLS